MALFARRSSHGFLGCPLAELQISRHYKLLFLKFFGAVLDTGIVGRAELAGFG